MDMKKRVWALGQVGKWAGIDAMVAQIKDDEVIDMWNWIRLGLANTHGLSQEREMEAWNRRQELAMLGCGWDIVEELCNALLEKIKEG